MRLRFTIQTVAFHLLAFSSLCGGQNTRCVSRFPVHPICVCFGVRNHFTIEPTLGASAGAIASAATGADQGHDAFINLLPGRVPQEFKNDCEEAANFTASVNPPEGSTSDTKGKRMQTTELRHHTDGEPAATSAAVVQPQNAELVDHDFYYRNRLELTFDGGWLPINIPFVFDIFMGDSYNMTPLRYTLVPLVASLRWQTDDVEGPWIFRGNWDMTFSGSVTLIPRGPETRYFSYDMGIRRNFVPHRGRVAPYFDGRLGLGQINAKGPVGVEFAQGQNFTFTVNLGSGIRYNFNPRYSLSAGLNWMHISNLYLSEPAFANYGINVYGPMFGIDVRLGRGRHRSK
jgi:hypothetical protein